jgi:hypothetical protein
MPWYSITDGFDKDFGVDEWHGTNVFFRDGDRVFRTYFINNRGDEAMGHLELSRHHAAWASGGVGELARGLPRPRPTSGGTGTTATSRRSARPEVGRVSDAEAAFRNQDASTKP